MTGRHRMASRADLRRYFNLTREIYAAMRANMDSHDKPIDAALHAELTGKIEEILRRNGWAVRPTGLIKIQKEAAA